MRTFDMRTSPRFLLVFNLGSFWVKPETSPCTGRALRDERKRQATPDQQVEVLISRELTYEACLEHQKNKLISALPAMVVKVYIDILTRFSHVYSLDGLNGISLSQACIPENSSHRGKWWTECAFQGQGSGCGASDCLGLTRGSTGGHIPSTTCSNIFLCSSPKINLNIFSEYG